MASSRLVRPPDKALEAHELAIIDLLCEYRQLAVQLEHRAARAAELHATRMVRDTLIAAEVGRSNDGNAQQVVSTQRERARALSTQLDSLEEEQETLRASGADDVLRLRLRVSVLKERREALLALLRRPTDDRGGAAREGPRRPANKVSRRPANKVSRRPSSDASAAADAQLVRDMCRAIEHEGWAYARSQADELMDQTEALRQALVGVERASEAEAATRAAAVHSSATAQRKKLAPLRDELARLQAQVRSHARPLPWGDARLRKAPTLHVHARVGHAAKQARVRRSRRTCGEAGAPVYIFNII